MAFSGKATYTAGASLPEIAEDISDLVAINSPYETPLLDALGDSVRPARSTIHEWLEDTLLPNTDKVNDSSIVSPFEDTDFVVAHASRFRVGDQIRLESGTEVMRVTAVNTSTNTLSVERGFGGTQADGLSNGISVHIIGNAALEGADADSARFTSRGRQTNYTQIFASTVEVSGSELAVRQVGLADELDYQKQARTRELMRDLENSVINGCAPLGTMQGSATVRRSMRGIRSYLATNIFMPAENGFPIDTVLTEEQLNIALREIWKSSNGHVDLILVGGAQKRAINGFTASNRNYAGEGETFKNLVSVYESDYGVCRVVLSRYVPAGVVMLLDSSRIDVMPLSGRSFQYKPLASTGDRESGQVIGEYTLELRNENAHGIIQGLTA